MDAPWLLVALCTLLGLLIGSFLNVLAHRVPRGESISFPPSHCPNCRTPILRRHNVPVLGWLVLRGRCAVCQVHISARYPLVEAGTGVLFGVLAAWLGFSVILPVALVLATGAAGAALLVLPPTARLVRR